MFFNKLCNRTKTIMMILTSHQVPEGLKHWKLKQADLSKQKNKDSNHKERKSKFKDIIFI